MTKHPEVFIVSSGRAGSTLLQSLLNATGQIYIPQESDFIARAYPFFYKKEKFYHEDYKKIASIFRITSQDKGWGMDESHIVEHLKQHNPQTLANVFSEICELLHSRMGTRDLMWGIKRPVLIANIDRILSTYPNAKIVHIYRDGRDVFLSYKSIHDSSPIKFGPKGIFTNALYWIDGLRRVEEFRNSTKEEKSKRHVFEIKYEEIITNPEHTLKQLCSFIEIDYDPLIIENFYKEDVQKRVAPRDLMSSIHAKLSGKLDLNNVGKYLKKMNKREVFFYELLASPYLEKYGYEVKYSVASSNLFRPFRRLSYYVARQINDIRYERRDKRVFDCVSKSSNTQ
ncbi:MAG: sulfotransferase [Elainellaceae cyanobacterium]